MLEVLMLLLLLLVLFMYTCGQGGSMMQWLIIVLLLCIWAELTSRQEKDYIMEEINILQYFNQNASKEEWEIVQQVYAYELVEDLKDLGMEDKKEFNLAELAVIYTRACLEKDLIHMETINHELGGANNWSTKEAYIDLAREILEEYQKDSNKEEEK